MSTPKVQVLGLHGYSKVEADNNFAKKTDLDDVKEEVNGTIRTEIDTIKAEINGIEDELYAINEGEIE